MPSNKGVFEITILGCSGGPISGKTCSYLIKAGSRSYLDILKHPGSAPVVAVDAGSGLTALSEIIGGHDQLSLESNFLATLYSADLSEYDRCHYYQNLTNMRISRPFRSLPPHKTPFQLAWTLLNSISAYLITHAHLDHVSGLVINSPCFEQAKHVYGLPDTIHTLRHSVFNGAVWPDLVAADLVSLHSITPGKRQSAINPAIDVVCYPVAHGMLADNRVLQSSAFLLTDKASGNSVLIFGDLESDTSSGKDYNSRVWDTMAPLIVDDRLNTIIIECSSPDMPPPLYGHLTPTLLVAELMSLRKKCTDLSSGASHRPAFHCGYRDSACQPLRGLNVIITHIKEIPELVNPRTAIFDSLNRLNREHRLGVNFTIALPGITYTV